MCQFESKEACEPLCFHKQSDFTGNLTADGVAKASGVGRRVRRGLGTVSAWFRRGLSAGLRGTLGIAFL